jgi:Domain of Unknown Function (DUF1206)
VDLSAASLERSARSSAILDRLVRWGLVGYGVLHLVVGGLAASLVVAGNQPSSQGALAHLAAEPYGAPVLVAMAAGFAVLTVWQLIAASVGYRELDGLKRAVMRAGAACRVVTYGYLCFSLARLAAVGGGGSGSSPRKTSAGVLAEPYGRVLLGIGGLVVAGIGIGLAIYGLRREFVDQLDREARNKDRRVPIVILGQVGYAAKGLAFVIIGGLVCWAAVSDDPRKAGGLDQSLARLIRVPMGVVAVVAIGAGIACFGLYLFARARHLAPRTLTS